MIVFPPKKIVLPVILLYEESLTHCRSLLKTKYSLVKNSFDNMQM